MSDTVYPDGVTEILMVFEVFAMSVFKVTPLNRHPSKALFYTIKP